MLFGFQNSEKFTSDRANCRIQEKDSFTIKKNLGHMLISFL